jgi:hypothetical protein
MTSFFDSYGFAKSSFNDNNNSSNPPQGKAAIAAESVGPDQVPGATDSSNSTKFTLNPNNRLVRAVDTFDEMPVIHSKTLGVLPYAVRPDGSIAVLMGREANVQSRRWAPFEGAAKQGESVEIGAAREFVEETMGVVRLNTDLTAYLHEADVQALFQDQRYSHKVQLRYAMRSRGQVVKENTTLLLQVPYEAGLEKRFASIRRKVLHLASFCRALHKLRARVFAPLGLYGRGICENDRNFRVLDVVHISDLTAVEDGMRLTARVRCFDPLEPARPHMTCITVVLPCGYCVMCVLFFTYLALLRLKMSVSENVDDKIFTHPAVTTMTDEHGFMMGLRIMPDFLEKDHVRWFSHDELTQIYADHGHFDNELVRASTCALIETMLSNWRKWFGNAALPLS